MTTENPTENPAENLEPVAQPEEMLALIPWYVAGTLGKRDARRLAEAIESDPALARQVAMARDEMAAAAHLNELVDAPSARSMDKLFAMIDAEEAKPSWRASLSLARLMGLVELLTPRRAAFAAMAAGALILVQAGVIGAVMTRGENPGFSTASYREAAREAARDLKGTLAMVRFTPGAAVADMTRFLNRYDATVVEGPKPGGLFKVRFGHGDAQTQEHASELMRKLQDESVVSFVAPTE